MEKKQKIVVIGAGPVGSLAALYAASRGNDVEIYELRGGKHGLFSTAFEAITDRSTWPSFAALTYTRPGNTQNQFNSPATC